MTKKYDKVNKFESAAKDFKKVEFLEKHNKIDEEAEPEWFSYPVTRHDFVDLHGFDEDNNNNKDKRESPKTEDKLNFTGSSNQRKFFDAYRNDVGNRRQHNNNSNSYQNRNYRNHNSTNYSGNADKSHGYQEARFRNPLHQTSCKFFIQLS